MISPRGTSHCSYRRNDGGAQSPVQRSSKGISTVGQLEGLLMLAEDTTPPHIPLPSMLIDIHRMEECSKDKDITYSITRCPGLITSLTMNRCHRRLFVPGLSARDNLSDPAPIAASLRPFWQLTGSLYGTVSCHILAHASVQNARGCAHARARLILKSRPCSALVMSMSN